jgi:DNA-binding NtrC family response regulator
MNKRVLIIDDDKELCEELSEILQADGFDVDYDTDPLEGKARLAVNFYNVLILDFKMPRISGIDLLKEIQGKVKDMKIFIVSGSLSIEKLLKEQNLSWLVSGVFVKPLNIKNLLEALKH